MELKDEILNVVASSIMTGYDKASVEFCIKLLAFVVCKTEGLDQNNRKAIEGEIKWVLAEKLNEFKKT